MTGNSKHLKSLLGWERLDTVYYRSRILNKNNYKKIRFDYDNELIGNADSDVLKAFFFDFVAEYSKQNKIVTIKSINEPDTTVYSISTNNVPEEREENDLVSLKWDRNDSSGIILVIAFQYNVKVVEFGDVISEFDIDFVNEDDSMDTIWSVKENNIILSKRGQNFYKLNLQKRSIDIFYKNDKKNGFCIFDVNNWIVKDENSIILFSNKDILQVQNGRKLETLRENCQFDFGAFSFSHNFLSLFNSKLQKLFILSANSLNKTLVELNLKSKPKFLKWVGNDCVAVADSLDNEVHLYGPKGNYITFWFGYGNSVEYMETCMDGIKIFTSQNECYLISKVEKETKNIFQMGSIEQSSILNDCFEMYQNGEISKVLKILDSIDLNLGVSEIISASLQEFDPAVQKRLLSCATWGKSFMLIESVKNQEPSVVKKLNEQLQNACQRLRILNNISSFTNFRITNKELDCFGTENIIKYLVNRPDCFNNVHENGSKPILTECLKLSLYLKDFSLVISVMKTFCIRKIKFNDEKSDSQLFDDIIKIFDNLKLNKKLNFPFASLYKVCLQENRLELAKKLILQDAILKRHIMPLLALSTESSTEDRLHLNEVLIDTLNKVGDPILQLFVLFEFKKTYKSSQLSRFLMLNNEKIDLNLFFKTLENTENSLEQFGLSYDYYIQMDDAHGLLNLIWNKSNQVDISKSNALTQASVIYKRNASNHTASDLVCSQIIDRESKLFAYQKDIFDKHRIDCIDKTLNDTLKLLVTLGNKTILNQFVKEFQITDKQLYLCECLASITKESVDIEKILVLSSQRKFSSNIHLVYSMLIANKHFQEAGKIISLPNNDWPFEDKFNRFIECKQYQNALELAEYQKDPEAIAYVSNMLESTAAL